MAGTTRPQPDCTDEKTIFHSPARADLMAIVERELGAFIAAATELFGSEAARIAVESWIEELVMAATVPCSARDCRLVTIAAAARFAWYVGPS
jgi:hypothetical protein